MENKKFFYKNFLALILGIIFGTALWKSNYNIDYYISLVEPFGTIFISMLNMLAIPLILLSLIVGVIKFPTKKFTKLGLKMVLWYFLTSLLSTVVGFVIAFIVNPASNIYNQEAWKALVDRNRALEFSLKFNGSSNNLISKIFANPFDALANGNLIAILTFSVCFAIALRLLLEFEKEKYSEKINSLISILEISKTVIFKVLNWILEYSPLGIFALTSITFAKFGTSFTGPYLTISIAILLGTVFMILVAYPILMAIFLRINPFKILFKIKEAMVFAFANRNSLVTTPISLKVAKDNLKINEDFSSFAIPLGSTINVDGLCVKLPIFVILALNLFQMELRPTALIILILTITLVSMLSVSALDKSTAYLLSIFSPNSLNKNIMILFIVLQSIGLDANKISVICYLALGINPILDMFEALNNVTGDLICTYCVAKRSGLIEK